MSKFVGTGPSSYKKGTYWAAVSKRLRNTDLDYSHSNSCLLPSGIPMFYFNDSNEVNVKSRIKQLQSYFAFRRVPKQLISHCFALCNRSHSSEYGVYVIAWFG
jgi:hypothetical protein